MRWEKRLNSIRAGSVCGSIYVAPYRCFHTFLCFKKGDRMRNIKLSKNIFYVLLVLLIVPEIGYPQDAQPAQDKKPVKDCYESREDYGYIERRDIEPALPNVICSQTTSRVLWWGDPYDGAIPMGDMSIEADYSHEEAVVRPREKQLKILMPCTTCHNGKTVPVPKNKKPRLTGC